MDSACGVKVGKVELTNDAGSKVKAHVEIVIGGRFVAKGLRVIEGNKGRFVSMPSIKENGEYVDRFFPVTKEAREDVTKIVLEAFEKAKAA